MTVASLLALALGAASAPSFQDGRALLERGKLEEAEAALARGAAARPDDAATLASLVRVRTGLRMFPEAIRAAERLVALRPRDAEARGDLARLNGWMGDYDKAIVLYREALSLGSRRPGLESDLGDVLAWAHRWDEAERLYQEALAARPEHHEALKGLVRVRLQQGNVDGALEVAGRALRLYPRDPDLYRDRAAALATRGSLDEAARSLERAAALVPEDAGVLRRLGQIRYQRRDYAGAADAWRRAAALDPDGAGDHVMLARAHLALGHLAQAQEQLDLARRMNPVDPEVQRLAADLARERAIAPARSLSEWIELVAYTLLLLLVLAVVNREKRLLRRRPALSWFARWVVPTFVLVNLVFHSARGLLARYLDTHVAESGVEIVLFLGMGVAFVAVLHAERGLRDAVDEVVLAVGAHPDDVELGAAAFLLKLKASGARVYALTMTRGEVGAPGSGDREREARQAAAFMDLDGVWVLDFPDTRLGEQIPALRAAIEEKIREVGATMVLTHTEVDVHGDHRAVNAATREAARRVPTVLVYEDVSTSQSFVPDYYVDVTAFVGDHLKAVAFHRSQLDKTYMDPEVLRGRAAHRGMQVGVPYALAFQTVNLVR